MRIRKAASPRHLGGLSCLGSSRTSTELFGCSVLSARMQGDAVEEPTISGITTWHNWGMRAQVFSGEPKVSTSVNVGRLVQQVKRGCRLKLRWVSRGSDCHVPLAARQYKDRVLLLIRFRQRRRRRHAKASRRCQPLMKSKPSRDNSPQRLIRRCHETDRRS